MSDQETSYFFSLTPDHILNAVEASGLAVTGRCLQLNSMENRVYEVELSDVPEDALPSERYRVAKFYRPGRWTQEQILEEHEFLLDLQEYEIPVVAPSKFGDGKTLHKLPEGDFYYALFPKVGGRLMDEISDEQLEITGRLLGRLHNVGATKQAPHRLTLDIENYGWNALDDILRSDMLPESFAPSYRQLVENILSVIEPWFDDVPIQRIHGDFHVGNFIWGSDGPFVVDFDDMVTGPCVQDLWLLIPGRDQQSMRMLEAMLEGYEIMRDFDRSTLKLIEPLRSLRMIHFSAWISRRWRDPAFKQTFINFGTPQYWREELGALQEQYEIIHTGIDY